MAELADQRRLLFERAARELQMCRQVWRQGNAGKARVCARRAAGMAIRAWLTTMKDTVYGTNFMHHLGGLADDPRWPTAVRESAWRLAARGTPDGGFLMPLPDPLEPATDAASIIVWCEKEIESAPSADGTDP